MCSIASAHGWREEPAGAACAGASLRSANTSAAEPPSRPPMNVASQCSGASRRTERRRAAPAQTSKACRVSRSSEAESSPCGSPVFDTVARNAVSSVSRTRSMSCESSTWAPAGTASTSSGPNASRLSAALRASASAHASSTARRARSTERASAGDSRWLEAAYSTARTLLRACADAAAKWRPSDVLSWFAVEDIHPFVCNCLSFTPYRQHTSSIGDFPRDHNSAAIRHHPGAGWAVYRQPALAGWGWRFTVLHVGMLACWHAGLWVSTASETLPLPVSLRANSSQCDRKRIKGIEIC